MEGPPTHPPPPPPPPYTLWIGGTAALARTYFEEIHPAPGVPQIIVAAPSPPSLWTLPSDVPLVELDLTSEASVKSLFARLPHNVDSIILGVRLSLVWSRPEQHEKLCQHIGLLLESAAEHGVTSILHISSIAVSDHIVAQHLVTEDDPVPPVNQLSSPYDRFKLRCEQIVDDFCPRRPRRIKTWVHLRLSGLFSNDPACIQCTAVRRQWLLSVRSKAAIDFNSSKNSGRAIALLLERMHAATRPSSTSAVDFHGRQLFYYTRATPQPVPYWHHVRDYRRAHSVWYGLFLPGWLTDVTVPPFRKLMQLVGALCAAVPVIAALCKSLDYLMAVATAEHNADNTRFRTAFPAIEEMEETVEECFGRIQRLREGEDKADGHAEKRIVKEDWKEFVLYWVAPLLMMLLVSCEWEVLVGMSRRVFQLTC